jgi:hypothetical protein
MLNFKIKVEKKSKANKHSSMTLDTKHKEFVNEFAKNDNVIIPTMKNELKHLTQKIKSTEMSVEKKIEIKENMDKIKEEMQELRNKKKQYFLNNSKLIFDYFENKKNIAEGKPVENILNKNNLVNSFFKIKNTLDENNDLIHNQSENIVKKYMANIDDAFIDVNSFVCQSDVCRICRKGELIPHDDEGMLVCDNCFCSIPFLIENEKPSYKEPPKEVCFYAYKRINHFKEILAQFQGKETTQIPLEVIENIKLQVKKERMDLNQITNLKTKEILKKLGYNKYYEHIPFIKDKLGIKPPVMSPELEEILCNLFIELQSPYSKYVPKHRVNFLNYYYTAYKLCELLGETTYLEHFPMLKDKDKRIEQDSIWEKICSDLNWEFIPTM